MQLGIIYRNIAARLLSQPGASARCPAAPPTRANSPKPQIAQVMDRRGAVLSVDLHAIVSNCEILRHRASQAELAAAVKVDGYGLTGVSGHDRQIATIALGDADGWPRCLGNRGCAFIDGSKVPIIGSISMDSLILDISGLPAGKGAAGDMVELPGPHQSVDDIARDAETISYDFLTRLGQCLRRSYLPKTCTKVVERSPV